ncbi:hypothetical protein [Lacrimispora algidixylanolytica]|uniref:Uncharacterized protein n=1 Tax=Lacrimispora algidixylanolytica TaxID=94868 RepID=A0A419TD07_9FIRM|nr:hypothetical protein [Lacrimispora algidixylanolytica]RKD35327.1 hypothetical protein BET01_03010 [Lacrimispora algidixylanolytica]
MKTDTIFYKGATVSNVGLEEDEKQFLEFVVRFIHKAEEDHSKALLILPDYTALLKPYYWTGMGHISRQETIEAIGTCTDLTCSINKGLKIFDASGGRREKLRLCVMFHPERITLTKFIQQCQRLIKENISFSIGTPGFPHRMEVIRQLRNRLSPDIHIWIESIANTCFSYSQEDENAFRSIDPYFSVDHSKSYEQLFYEECIPVDDANTAVFGRYPLFHIPQRIRAYFICGDEIPRLELEQDESDLLIKLKDLKESTPLFLITSLPHKEASRTFRLLFPLISGGVFAGGSHISSNKKGRHSRRDEYIYMNQDILTLLKDKQSEYGCQIRILEHEDMIYRLTMEKPFSRIWREAEQEALIAEIPDQTFRFYIEENCFHIISADANEENGITLIRRWLTINSEDYEILKSHS